MLSTENDSPWPQLKNASDDDERPFLPEEPLLFPTTVSDAQLAKFSIRDYVFTARSKDIKTNWPFSQKSLQLCLDCGVKELLPPFHFGDTLRNLSIEACASKNIRRKEESTSNINAEPSYSKNHSDLDRANNIGPIDQQAKGCSADTLSSWSEGEKEFPSTATSVSQSEIESVQIIKPSYLPLEADTLLGVEAEGSAPVRKSENTARPLGKKCKLIMKSGPNPERSSVEDIASNYSSVSEMMTSKVCPVCKTFTSSSNTTLNAHIDQCLTVEPTSNWTSDAKLTRHKIKPRQTKLMTDIYATAKPCTLEELDKRNGRNCLTFPSLPMENDNRSDISGTRRMQMASPHKPEGKSDVGVVYIDANGTKVRILSKSTDVPSPLKVAEEPSPKIHLGGIQSKKCISKKKKRHHLLKHDKYLHLTSQRKVSFHKCPSSQSQVGASYAGVLQPWVCSKRTVAAKKVNGKVRGQHFKAKEFPSQEMVVNNTQLAGRNQHPDIAASVKSLHPCNDQNKERKGNVRCATKESSAFKQTLQQKSVNFPAIDENMERSLPQIKEKASLLSKDGHIDHLPSYIGLNHCSSLGKCIVADVNSVDDSYHGSGSNIQLSGSSSEVTVNATSLKRRFLSFGDRSTKTAYKANMSRKSLSLRNSHEHASQELDEQLEMHSGVDQPCMRRTTGEVESPRKRLFRVRTLLEAKQASRVTSFLKRRKGMFTPLDRLNDTSRNGDAFFGLSNSQENSSGSDSGKETNNIDEDDNNVLRSSRGSLRHGGRTLTEPIDQELEMPFENDQAFCKFEGFINPDHSGFINEPESRCAFEVDEEMIKERNCMIDELGSKLEEEKVFSIVDPIPIPGPPGSFLPSPGGTNLEEFQGNSLTTTNILSSADQHDLVEGCSSDSPISATMTKSDSSASISDKRSQPFSLGLCTVEDVTRTVASGARSEISIENRADVPQTSASMERIRFDGTLNGNKFLAQKGSLGLEREDSHSCCCHMKERLDHVVAYNFEETQLMKRPILASLTMPVIGRQIDLEPKREPRVLDRLPDEFSFPSCTSFGSLDVSIPKTNSVEGPVAKSPDAGLAPGRANSDSISPSSNPTLRLMGKNLMVVNKDEDSSVSLGLNAPNPFVCYPFRQVSAFTRTPPHCMQNHTSYSYDMSPQNAVNVVQDPEESMKQSYGTKLAKSMNIQSVVKVPQTLPVVTTGFLNQSKEVCFKSSNESYEHMRHYYINTLTNQLKNSSTLHNVERVHTVPDCQKRTGVCAPTSLKEIIFIDDIPKNAVEASADVATHHGELRERSIFSHGILNSAAESLDPKNLNSFPGALNMVHDASINGTPSRQVGGVSVRWSCIPEGVGGQNQNPFVAGSSSTHHSRSVTAKPLGFACRRLC